ncbi:MAG: tetratricopeptide repeat protein, partial [Planctomycetota bacterium]|nr:tetratricopeptide repeat protein [Planctomycetota bacterium]
MANTDVFGTTSVSGFWSLRQITSGRFAYSKARTRRCPVARLKWPGVCVATLLSVNSCVAPSVTSGEKTDSTPGAAYDPARAFVSLDVIEPRPIPAVTSKMVEHVPPAPAARYLRQGRRNFEERLWTGAITALEKALKLDPQLVEARILLARAALRQGNHDWAESHLREALGQRPNDVAVNQLLCDIAWRANHSGEAIRFFRLALMSGDAGEVRPETVLAHLSLAMALRKEGYLSASIGQLEAYLAAVSDPTEAMSRHEELKEVMVLYRGTAAGLQGEIHSQLGQHEEAVLAYRRASEEVPGDFAVKDRLARSLAKAGHSEEALGVVHELLANSRSQVDGLQLLRDVCTLLGDADRFDAEIARLATEATNPVLQRRLARVLEERGKTEAAISVLERLTKRDPAQRDAAIQLAGLYLESRRLDDFLEAAGRVALDDGEPSDRADALLTETGSNAGLRNSLLVAAEQWS